MSDLPIDPSGVPGAQLIDVVRPQGAGFGVLAGIELIGLIAVIAGADTDESGGWMLNQLNALGRALLARSAFAVQSGTDPGVDPHASENAPSLHPNYVRNVLVIFFDRYLNHGETISRHENSEPARQACLDLAATVTRAPCAQPDLRCLRSTK